MNPSVHPFVSNIYYSFIHSSIHPSIHLLIVHPSIYPSTHHPSIYPSTCLPIYPSTHSSIHLSVHIAICLSAYMIGLICSCGMTSHRVRVVAWFTVTIWQYKERIFTHLCVSSLSQITAKMKQSLKSLGYSTHEMNKMTPATAHEIIKTSTRKL